MRQLFIPLALANALEIPVTAEGIETETQARIAKLCGCDLLQGYLFGKPLPAEEISRRFFNTAPDTALVRGQPLTSGSST